MEAYSNIWKARMGVDEQLIDEAVREHQNEMRIRGRQPMESYAWAYDNVWGYQGWVNRHVMVRRSSKN